MKRIVQVIFFLSSLLAFMSNVDAQEFCGTSSKEFNKDKFFANAKASNAGPYTLRIYVHVTRMDNGTGGMSTSEVDQALDYLDDAFNPHNIFFVWDGCIDYIYNSNWYKHAKKAMWDHNPHQDGIDIYFGNNDRYRTVGGMADGVGMGSAFWIQGIELGGYNGQNALSHLISHEMGHVINLHHTHRSCGGTWELLDGSNCSTAGDLICDTPPDGDFNFNHVDANTCEWTFEFQCNVPEPPITNYNPLTDNYMSYTKLSCMNNFTSDQAERMRAAIVNLPHLIDAQYSPCTFISCTPLAAMEINSDQTIDSPTAFGTDLIIKSGVTLTVTSSIEFTEGNRLIVEQGAKLHLDGGLLTKCASAEGWAGVIVEGISSQIQPSSTAPLTGLDAGILLCTNGAIIEYAVVGISAEPYLSQNGFGGLVECSNTTFRNNILDISITKYGLANKSNFKDCTFDGQGLDNFNIGVQLDNVHDVLFERCQFTEYTQAAIHVVDAAVIVQDNNQFQSNNIGIWIETSQYNSNFSRIGKYQDDPNDFIINQFDIYVHSNVAATKLSVEDNEFLGGNVGIYVFGPANFYIDANVFSDKLNGIVLDGTSTFSNMEECLIRNNTFQTQRGIWANGPNATMEFVCNEFDCFFDIIVEQGLQGAGAIKAEQGAIDLSAFNCFSTGLAGRDITTIGTTIPFVYYGFNESCKMPFNIGNYTTGVGEERDCRQDIGLPGSNYSSSLIVNQTSSLFSEDLIIDNFEEENTSFKIYPNPAFSKLNISKELKDKEEQRFYLMSITDVSGKKVLNRNVSDLENNLIDISSWAKGLYFISIIDELGNLIQTEKIILQND